MNSSNDKLSHGAAQSIHGLSIANEFPRIAAFTLGLVLSASAQAAVITWGAFSGLPQGALVGNFGGTDLFIDYASGDGNDVVLYTAATGSEGATAVPEPATLLLALLALVAAPLRVRCG